MQKIVPHLWYDTQALEAATYYVSLFENSRILQVNTIYDTPSGDSELVDFELAGFQFSAMSAGPIFTMNASVSIMVGCKEIAEVDRLYQALITGGMAMMPLDAYPFSKRYAWVQDKYGLSWQLMYEEALEADLRIRPSLLFAGEACGKAEAAIDFITEVFDDSKKGYISYYGPGEASDSRAKINYSELTIRGIPFVFMDHGFGGTEIFNEAISFIISCDTQKEIDYYWDKISFVPEAEQCGWVKDRFGISWQVVPTFFNTFYSNATAEEAKRVTEVLLEMHKIDLQQLLDAKNKNV